MQTILSSLFLLCHNLLDSSIGFITPSFGFASFIFPVGNDLICTIEYCEW